MAHYWVIRTDRQTTAWIWEELQAGRLRQGWGLRDEQNLRLIAAARAAGTALNDGQRSTWRGNRRLLDTEPDGVRVGDLVLLPHLARHGA